MHLTSPTVFHFALDPEKHWEVDVTFFFFPSPVKLFIFLRE